MRVLTLARLSIWCGVGGSAILATLMALKPELENLLKTIQGVDVKAITENLDAITKSWTGLSALLVGGGAVGIRQVIAVDKRLNGDWHWVATIVESQSDLIIKVSRGVTKISDITDWQKRLENPNKVLHGQTIESNGVPAGDNGFVAKEILVARDSTIFYEWEYMDNKVVTGWTRLKCLPTGQERGFFSFRRPEVHIVGTFCMANSYGTGTINFFAKEKTAKKEYEKRRSDMVMSRPAAQDTDLADASAERS